MSKPLPALAIHVDLDGVHQIFRAHGRTYGGSGDPIFMTGMENVLALFASAGVRATLFVIAEDVRDPSKRGLLAQAVSQGHELASHTITHPNLLRLTSAAKRRELADSKTIIEDALGVSVTGFRAPGYAIDAEALSMLANAGYVYDSSVFPTTTFAERLGRPRTALRSPQRFDALGGIVELPLPGPMPLGSPIGPSFALAFGLPAFYWAMARVARRGMATVLLYHLIDFAAPLDRASRGGARMSLFTLSTRSERAKQAACARMLRFVQRRFRLTTTHELVAPFLPGAMTAAAS